MKVAKANYSDTKLNGKDTYTPVHHEVYSETPATVQLQELQDFADESANVVQLLRYEKASHNESIVQRSPGALAKLGDFSGQSKPSNPAVASKPVAANVAPRPFEAVDAHIESQNHAARVAAHEERDRGPSRRDERRAASEAMSHHIHDHRKIMGKGALVGGAKGMTRGLGKYGGAVGGAVLGGLAGAPAGPPGIATGAVIGGMVGASLGAGAAGGAISVVEDVSNNRGKAPEDKKSIGKMAKSAGFNVAKAGTATAVEGLTKVGVAAISGPAAPVTAPLAGMIAEKGTKAMFDKAAGGKKSKDGREQKPPSKAQVLVAEMMAQQNQLNQMRVSENPQAEALLHRGDAKGISKIEKVLKKGKKKARKDKDSFKEIKKLALNKGPEFIAKLMKDDEAGGDTLEEIATDELVPGIVSEGLSSGDNVADFLGVGGESLSGAYGGYKKAGKAYDKKTGELERQKDQAYGLDTVGRTGNLHTTSL